jgi:putative transposase
MIDKERMQMKKRKTFTDKFKSRVALDSIKGMKTLSELATEYKVHPNQVSQWKKLLVTGAPGLFSGGKRVSADNDEKEIAALYEEIGRLKMDIKWLEKKL